MKNLKKFWIQMVSFFLLLNIFVVIPGIDSFMIANAASKVSASKILEMNYKSVALAIDQSTYLELENATRFVTWKSEDPYIATVNEYGYVTAVSEGVTQIYAIHAGNVYISKVTVYKERLKLTSSEYWMYEDSSVNLTLLNKKSFETITVSSSDATIASVDKIEWKKNNASIFVKVGKKGTITLSIKRSKSVEPCKVIIHVISKEERIVPDATEIYKKVSQSMVEIKMLDKDKNESLGSGFFIDEGMILTNYHVIEDAASIEVYDYDGKRYEVTKIYDYNEAYDLAVIGVKGTKQVLTICKDKVVAGEKVYAIGSPYGYTGTFSSGIIAMASRVLEEVDYIQITAPISRGNSGGPLLNRYGEVVGVNTLTQLNAQNLNFSVNIGYFDKLDLSTPKDISTYLKKFDSYKIS